MTHYDALPNEGLELLRGEEIVFYWSVRHMRHVRHP